MELLIKPGACVDAADRFGCTLLMRAASSTSLNKISILFRYNAKINLREGQNAIEINVVMSNPIQSFRGRHRRNRFGESKIDKATQMFQISCSMIQN